MFDTKKIYVGKIYRILGLETCDTINNCYCAFIKKFNEKNSNDDYILINRGQLNKKTIMFKHGTIFNQIEDIDITWDESIPSYYVSNLKPLTKFMKTDDIKSYMSYLDIHQELFKINTKEEVKKMKIKK